jgi:methyltransferase (TIGR00027 family)
MAEHEIDAKKSAIPFTARLIAYYRAMESRREDPLIVDPYAERLAGDMDSYFRNHLRARGTSDYAVVRTHYIDTHILSPWCKEQEQSQIVLLGAGLDARAYRFAPLKDNNHTFFEVDFDQVNKYKKAILSTDRPLCDLIRVSADLSEPTWISQLERTGFASDIPTIWLLEGLVYYIEQELVMSILKTAALSCVEESKLFADVCVPGLSLAQYGPFMMHFKWGLKMDEVPSFFAHSGWKVTCAYADDYDHGRDVGQRGLIFVTGIQDLSKLGQPLSFSIKAESERIPESELKSFSLEFLQNIVPEIENIVDSYKREPDTGMTAFLEFINGTKPSIEMILKNLATPLSIGKIAPRLLRNPTTVEIHSREEEEAHIAGYLSGIILLAYSVAKGLESWQLTSTSPYQESMKIQGKVDALLSLLDVVMENLDSKFAKF